VPQKEEGTRIRIEERKRNAFEKKKNDFEIFYT